MSDYDNTNRGAVFPPFAQQQMILQGKLNHDGADLGIVLVRDETKNGKVIIGVYQKVGVLFQNEKTSENQPDYTGTLERGIPDKRLAAWKKLKDGKPYMTLSVSERQQGSEVQPDTKIDDSIPF